MNFVLIHGGWHEGSCWDWVIAELDKLGHQACAPTLAGHGNGVEKQGITHAISTQSAVDYVSDRNLHDFVLVGHSYGGSIIQKMAEQLDGRIRRLVFLNAFVLNDGQCLLDENPPHYRELAKELAAKTDDDSCLLPFEICREAFFNSVDLATAKTLWQTLFSPQPLQTFRDSLDLKKFYSLNIPKSYLNCTEDMAIPQGPEYGWHPRLSSRLGLFRLVQMEGDHESLATSPQRLAKKLIEAGRD